MIVCHTSGSPTKFRLDTQTEVPVVRLSNTRCRHTAYFYSDDSHLLDNVSQFAGSVLRRGGHAIVIATEAHRERFLLRLQMRGLNMNAAIQNRRYTALDASDALGQFMVNGLPDRTRFFQLLDDLLSAAREAGRRVVLFGECADMLWTRGNQEGAFQLEKLGNQMITAYNVDLLCGYSLGGFQLGAGRPAFEKICAEHSAYDSH